MATPMATPLKPSFPRDSVVDNATLTTDVKFASRHLAAFYYQLGTLVHAGLPIRSALDAMQKSGPRAMRAVVVTLSEAVNEGHPLSEGMDRCGKLFAPLDRHAVDLSAQGGALDVGLLSLSKYYEGRASARNKIIAGSMYPAVLLLVAVFGSRFPAFFLGASAGKPYTTLDYLRDTVGLLAILGLIAGGAVWLLRWCLRTPGLNVTIDRLLQAVPVLGRLRFDYALSQWVLTIRLMLRAGIGVVPALEYASRSVNSPLIAYGYAKAAPRITAGLQVS